MRRFEAESVVDYAFFMAVQWDDRLLEAALRRARIWAGENPIKYSLVFGAPAVVLQAAIFAGVLRIGDLLLAVLSLVIVPTLIVGYMICRTLLAMLYEVREALGEHLDPSQADGDPRNFSCELTNSSANEWALRVVNHDSAGEFHAKVIELDGVESSPAPISIRWRGDETARTRRINLGDSEVLAVVRVRGRRAVDFLQPLSVNAEGYQRVAALNGDRVPGDPSVAAVIRVFNSRPDAEGQRTHILRMTFPNGADAPICQLEPVAEPAG